MTHFQDGSSLDISVDKDSFCRPEGQGMEMNKEHVVGKLGMALGSLPWIIDHFCGSFMEEVSPA